MESSFLLAQALGFQASVVLERSLAVRGAEVERYRRCRRERDEAEGAAWEAKAKAERVKGEAETAREASWQVEELEAEIARLREEAVCQKSEAEQAVVAAWSQGYEAGREATEQVAEEILRGERAQAAVVMKERDESGEGCPALRGEDWARCGAGEDQAPTGGGLCCS